MMALVAGTMAPTSGSIRTTGSISSLLELGAGFHPDLSGRENVYLAGAIIGLNREQMRRRFDSIVEFAELEDYIEEPVKHYSSGMYVRLGFAVAVEVDPDILLIDEVLAVGDAVFERKCLDRIEDFRKRGKSMLIISHDLRTIQKVSDRMMLLEAGRVKDSGRPNEVVEKYQAAAQLRHRKSLEKEWGTRDVTITGVEICDAAGRVTHSFRHDEPVDIRIHYDASRRIDAPVFGFSISDEGGRRFIGNNSQIEGHSYPAIQGRGCVMLRLPRFNLGSGTYLMSFSVHSSDHLINYHRLDNCFPVEITCADGFEGAYLKSEWSAAREP
jgi:ABC-type polysaccharide/polyol phosphate transport system ATPase subunit